MATSRNGRGRSKPKTKSQLNDLIVHNLPGTLTVGDGKTIPDPEYNDIKERLAYFRYREKFNLSVVAMGQEPIDEVEFAIAVWAADNKRAKLESRKQEAAIEEQRTKKNGQVETD